MDYGISNKEGKPTREDAANIITCCQKYGVDVIDTAHGYGESELVLGMILPDDHSFRIITKTPGYGKKKLSSDDAEDMKKVFHLSLNNLKQKDIDGLLIHNAEDLLIDGGELLFDAMQELKEQGLVHKVGASVYTGEQIERLMEKYVFDIIQLPINILDRRLIAGGHLTFLKEKGVEIHARSIFLQGLLLMPPDSLHPYFHSIRPMLKQYHAFLQDQEVSLVGGALCFIRQIEEIDYVILGVASVGQLEVDVHEFRRHCADELLQGLDPFSLDDPRYLNPALWRLR